MTISLVEFRAPSTLNHTEIKFIQCSTRRRIDGRQGIWVVPIKKIKRCGLQTIKSYRPTYAFY